MSLPGLANLSRISSWHVCAGQLALRLPSGKVINPTAGEVLGAEYKRNLNIRGETVPCHPSEELPTINFSRYPLDVRIDINPPSADLANRARCQLTLIKDGKPCACTVGIDDSQAIIGENWFPLPSETMEQIRAIFVQAKVEKPGEITLRQYLRIFNNTPEFVHINELLINPDITKPSMQSQMEVPGLNATLYPYQIAGLEWMIRVSDEDLGCILGDQMGLGKTLQVIALLLRESQVRKSPCLVIVPATLVENWRRELARFAPCLSVNIHQGRGRSGFPKTLQTFDVVITSYETGMRDISILEMISWNVVVLDEAQAIKTPDAQRTVTLKSLPRRVAVAVTGTPVENRLRDLWSLMDFVIPGFLGTQKTFETRHIDDERHAAELEPLVSPFILRRLVEDVAKDLPIRIDIPQPILLSDVAAARYDYIRAQIKSQYGQAASLVVLTKLRMYCTHPFLIEGDVGDPLPCSTKYARLLEILDEVYSVGEKVLIFTSYTKMADIFMTDLGYRYGATVAMIDGRTPVSERQSIVDRFGQATTSAILILNPRAAGTGLNIVAGNHVIHYNLEWNPAMEDQATARAYRRGQTRPVTIHRLFHPGTVEEVIEQRMARKRSIANTAVIGTDGNIEEMADILRAMDLSPVLGGIK